MIPEGEQEGTDGRAAPGGQQAAGTEFIIYIFFKNHREHPPLICPLAVSLSPRPVTRPKEDHLFFSLRADNPAQRDGPEDGPSPIFRSGITERQGPEGSWRLAVASAHQVASLGRGLGDWYRGWTIGPCLAH